MIESFMHTVSDLVNGAPLIAMAACLAWGFVSVLVSPCHLAAIPMVMSYASMQEENLTPRRATLYAVLFCTGMVCVITLLGTAFAVVGRLTGGVPEWVEALGGALLVLLAWSVWRHTYGGMPPQAEEDEEGDDEEDEEYDDAEGEEEEDEEEEDEEEEDDGSGFAFHGMPGALALGVVFGVLSGSCAFLFLAPVVAVVFTEGLVLKGALMTACFAIGHCFPIALAGPAAVWFSSLLGKRHRALTIFTCAVIALVGVYFIYHGLAEQHVHTF